MNDQNPRTSDHRPSDLVYPAEFGPRPYVDDATADAEHRRLTRELLVRRILVGIVVLLVLVLLGTTTVSVILVRQQQVDRAPITDQIANCTTPGRPCYERSQSQLRAIVGQLNQYGAIVSACASGPEQKTYEQVVRCAVAKAKSLPPIPIPQK